MKVQKLSPSAILPTKAHESDAAFDLYLPVGWCVTHCYGVTAFPLGIALEIPDGYYGQIIERSSLAKLGWKVLGGVIDSGYRGEITVIIEGDGVGFSPGDRVAQLLILPVPQVKVVEVDTLSETPRGTGGFGSTGK